MTVVPLIFTFLSTGRYYERWFNSLCLLMYASMLMHLLQNINDVGK